MLLFETSNIIIQSLEQWRLRVLIELSKLIVEVSEESNIVDSSLHFQAVKNASPDVFVPVIKMLQLNHEVIQSSLMEVNLRGK